MTLDEDWYRDPTGRHRRRYWDGAHWTELVKDGTEESTDPLTGSGVLVSLGPVAADDRALAGSDFTSSYAASVIDAVDAELDTSIEVNRTDAATVAPGTPTSLPAADSKPPFGPQGASGAMVTAVPQAAPLASNPPAAQSTPSADGETPQAERPLSSAQLFGRQVVNGAAALVGVALAMAIVPVLGIVGMLSGGTAIAIAMRGKRLLEPGDDRYQRRAVDVALIGTLAILLGAGMTALTGGVAASGELATTGACLVDTPSIACVQDLLAASARQLAAWLSSG